MVRHAVLSLEALITNRTLEGLFVRMGELVPVEVVHVSEGLPTHLTRMVLLDRLTGFLDRLGHGHSCAAGTAAGVGAHSQEGSIHVLLKALVKLGNSVLSTLLMSSHLCGEPGAWPKVGHGLGEAGI